MEVLERRSRRLSESSPTNLEELAELSFEEGKEEAEAVGRRWWLEPSSSAHWTKGMEWEARIPPIADEEGREELVWEYHSRRSAFLRLLSSLAEENAECLELEELLERAGEGSLQWCRIRQALEKRYYDNPDFLAKVAEYEELHGRLSTIRARVLDWDGRRDAELLSGSLSSLDMDDSASSADSCLFEPALPPLPELPTRPSPPLPRRKSQPLNPNASDFVPAAAAVSSASPPPQPLGHIPVLHPTPSSTPPTTLANPVLLYATKAALKRASPVLFPYTLAPFPLALTPQQAAAAILAARPHHSSKARKRLLMRTH